MLITAEDSKILDLHKPNLDGFWLPLVQAVPNGWEPIGTAFEGKVECAMLVSKKGIITILNDVVSPPIWLFTGMRLRDEGQGGQRFELVRNEQHSKAVSVRMGDSYFAAAKQLGTGNVGEGIRKAIELAQSDRHS